MYTLKTDDRRYRHKLKHRIIRKYSDILEFVQHGKTEILMKKESMVEHIQVDKDTTIKDVAKIIRKDIIDQVSGYEELSLPIRIDHLQARNPPASTNLFLSHLLKSEKHSVSKTEQRLIESYAADFVHGVTKGKAIIAKHFAVGTGLHNITGSNEVVQIIHNLGHSISYPLWPGFGEITRSTNTWGRLK